MVEAFKAPFNNGKSFDIQNIIHEFPLQHENSNKSKEFSYNFFKHEIKTSR